MATLYTPLYGLAYADTQTAIVDIAAVTQQVAQTTETALTNRGIPNSDLQALIAAGWFTDSGWLTITPAAGFTAGNSLALRRLGKRVHMRGSLVRTAGSWTTTAETGFSLPGAAYRPTVASRFQVPGFASATANGLIVTLSSTADAVTVAGLGASTNTAYFDGVSWVIA